MPQTAKQNNNSVRIIAGEYRSRKLEFPNLEGLRPTADRVRETLFNWLQDRIQGETCLDLFAGSGALGFESLSRGAIQVDFIEKNIYAVRALRANTQNLDAKNANVYCADGIEWLHNNAQSTNRYGIVFLDPPFKGELLKQAIQMLESANILREDGLIYVEQEKQSIIDVVPDNWEEVKSKKAGSVQFSLYKLSRDNG